MSNNPSRETPYCIFYKEDLSGLESEPIQVSQIEAGNSLKLLIM